MIIIPRKKKRRKYFVYFGCSNQIGRIGARFYGLVFHRTPLLAAFVDDGWYDPAISFGLALGPLEVGVFVPDQKEEAACAPGESP